MMLKTISKLMPRENQKRATVDDFFVNAANQVIDELNAAIHTYQGLSLNEDRIAQLKHINSLRKQLEDMCPQDISVSDFSESVLNNFFIQLADECKSLGIGVGDLEEVPDELRNIPFVGLLANMHPEVLREMFEILYSARKGHIKGLWDPDLWTHFVLKHPEFDGYQIKCISAGNAKNFILTPLDPNVPKFIIRIDDRLGGARANDAEIRKTELAKFLTPIAGTRLISSGKFNPTILITTVCPNGNPLDHAKNNVTIVEKIQGASEIYSQMAHIFLRMQAHNVFCPDGKNENWLLDDKNQLCVADNKSWMFSKDGYHDIDETFSKNCLAYGAQPSLIANIGFMPSYINNQRFEIDKMHCYMLGNNMYQYLTGCSNALLHSGVLDFDEPVFKTPDGQQFVEMIKACRKGTTTVLSILGVLNTIKENNQQYKERYNNLISQDLNRDPLSEAQKQDSSGPSNLKTISIRK